MRSFARTTENSCVWSIAYDKKQVRRAIEVILQFLRMNEDENRAQPCRQTEWNKSTEFTRIMHSRRV